MRLRSLLGRFHGWNHFEVLVEIFKPFAIQAVRANAYALEFLSEALRDDAEVSCEKEREGAFFLRRRMKFSFERNEKC